MRFFASVFLFTVTVLFGCNSEFSSCLKKVQDLHVIQKNALVIPLEKHTLVFSTQKLHGYKFYDPFLNLYMFPSKNVSYPFKWNKYLKTKKLAAINNKVVCGKIVQDQVGLDKFGLFSKSLSNSAVILNSCCELIAINTPKGIIQKRYLQRFLSGKNSYGDIGIRVKMSNKCVIVDTVNRLIHSPFKKNDILLKINDRRIVSMRSFEEKILFAPIGKFYQISVMRNKKKKNFRVKVLERKGGGFLCDTFFEVWGVYIDKNLRVVRSSYKNLHVNDKIFMIDKQKVQTQKGIQRALSDVGDIFRIGLNRKGLDIFIEINTRNKNGKI